MKPLIVINNFDVWVTYDETDAVSWSFSDIEAVDIISEPWVAKAQKDVVKIIDVPDNSSISHFLEWAVEPRKTWNRNYTYYLDTYNWQVLQSDDSGNVTVFRSLWGWVLPNHSQMVVMQDQLLLFPYKDGTSNKLASTYAWTTGENSYITASWANLTLSTLQDRTWLENAPWEIFLEQSPGIFQSYTISTWTDNNHVVLSSSYTWSLSGWMRGYFFRHYNDYYNPALNTTTTINFTDKNPMFKPMLHKDWDAYIWDWDNIIRINKLYTPIYWNNTIAKSITPWFTIKKIFDYNGKLFILADDTANTQYWTWIPYVPEANSSIFIIPNTEKVATDIIQSQGHIIDWIIADNRLYMVIKTEREVVLSIFNWSDFDTITTISRTSEQQYPNILAAYRWALYMYISEGTSKNYIYSFSRFWEGNYKLIKIKNMGTKLPWPTSFLIWFSKSTLKAEKRWNLIVSIRGDWIYEMKTNKTGYYQSFDDLTQTWPSITTKTYEITQTNFRNLIVWLWIMCKELIPSWCKIWIDYKLDNSTNWTSLWDFTSSNQEFIKNNINKRSRRATFRIRFYTNTSNTWKLIELRVYWNIPQPV